MEERKGGREGRKKDWKTVTVKETKNLWTGREGRRSENNDREKRGEWRKRGERGCEA